MVVAASFAEGSDLAEFLVLNAQAILIDFFLPRRFAERLFPTFIENDVHCGVAVSCRRSDRCTVHPSLRRRAYFRQRANIVRMQTLLVTGGAGFIGSCFVRRAIARGDVKIINLDKLTYAGNPDSLPAASDHHELVVGDIGDRELVRQLLSKHKPDAIVNFAAESHVDRSIDGPLTFVETNVLGTCRMLEEVRAYYGSLSGDAKAAFRFLHVSTDEVYGSLGATGLFTEETSYSPNSPYSASKAASDHFVRAYTTHTVCRC